MAYLTYFDTNWYVYWTHGGTTTDDQTIEIAYLLNDEEEKTYKFTYKELANIKNVEQLKKILNLDINEDELLLCLEAINEWKKDVKKAEKENPWILSL